MSRAAPIVGLVVTLLVCGPVASGAPPEPRASLPDIEDEVMCPICGTTLELSESPQAERERELIRRLVEEGQTKEEIKNALEAEYGPEVLATPSDKGFELTAWIVPPIVVLLSAGAIAVGLWRQGRRRPKTQPAVDPLNRADLERLERDRSSYDL